MSAKPPRILLADDDPQFCRLAEHLFTKFGAETTSVHTPHDFIENIKKKKFDLCVVDLNMGIEAVGAQVVKAVRKVMGPKTPILLVSSHYDEKFLKAAWEAGADDYLVKPLDRRVLTTKIARFFRTDAMKQWLEDPTDVSAARTTVEMNLSFRVVEVRESGLRVSCPYFIWKGTTLQASGSWWRNVLGIDLPKVELTVRDVVKKAGKTPQDRHYLHFLEFTDVDVQFMRSIRFWLMRQKHPLSFREGLSESAEP